MAKAGPLPPLPSSLPGSGPELGTSADPKAVGARIGEIRGRSSQEVFGAELGVHENTLGRYERGERLPDAEFLAALATKRNISTHWVLYGVPPQKLSDTVNPEIVRAEFWKTYSRGLAADPGVADSARAEYIADADLVFLPHYDVRAAAGAGALVDDKPGARRWAFDRTWLAQEVRVPPHRLVLINVTGDSLDELHDGDIVMVDRGDIERIREGIYVFELDGQLYVKRLSMHGKQLLLSSRHGTEPLQENPSFKLIGRVVGRPRFDRL